MEKLLPRNVASNTTFDDVKLIETLNEIKKSSVAYTTEVQRDLVGYHKFEFRMSDFTLDRSSYAFFTTARRYVINVPKQLLHTANKEGYKKSDLFMKELSIKEISDAGNLFTYNFIVFIDGKAYTNLKLVINEYQTYVVLYINNNKVTDGFDLNVFEDLVDQDVPVTVFFIPNSLYAECETNQYVIKKYSEGLPLSRFKLYGKEGKDMLSYSIVSTGTNKGSIFSQSISLQSELVKVRTGFERHIEESCVSVGVINFNFFDRIIEIPVGGDFFELPIREHVVPTTSFLAFYEAQGALKFYHNLEVQYHYPNIYEVRGNDVPLKLHVFYHKPLDGVQFVNEMELYYRFFGDTVLEKWRNDTIPDMIKNFTPNVYPVSIRDLLASEFSESPMNYKVDTMNDFIELESKTLGTYLMNMLRNRKKMRIYTKNVDLASKLRTNVKGEIPTIDHEFDEPRYVFLFAKYFINEFDLRFFIDGKFYLCDETYADDQYHYYYIPQSLLTDRSLIEIEKHRSISHYFRTDFTVPIRNVTIKDNPCLASDAIFMDQDGTILDEIGFKFIITENGKKVEIDTNSNKPLGDKFRVKCIDSRYRERRITILFKRLSSVFEYRVEDELDTNKTLLIGTDLSRYDGHFRIYRNGRLVPPAAYTIKFKKRQQSYTVINLKMKKVVGDVYHIEVNPNIYYTNYFTYKIPTDGFLDFGGRLNKPFNLKWFDVFLNGYKLCEQNFDILTPRYALIKGVRTVDNLLIMEKNWVDDVFKFRTTPENPVPPMFDHNSCTDDELFDNIGDLQEEIDKIKQEIIVDDTIDNVLTDIIEDNTDDLIQIMPEIIRHFLNIHTYINPDVDYESGYNVPYEILELIRERNNIIAVFPHCTENTTTPVIINPDKEGLYDPDALEIENGVIIH